MEQLVIVFNRLRSRFKFAILQLIQVFEAVEFYLQVPHLVEVFLVLCALIFLHKFDLVLGLIETCNLGLNRLQTVFDIDHHCVLFF
jgi:hypothetical protein